VRAVLYARASPLAVRKVIWPSNCYLDRCSVLTWCHKAGRDGISVYSPLKVANIKIGDKVAVAEISGAGCLSVRYSLAFGTEVTVFDWTEEKRTLVSELGAAGHVNVNNHEEKEQE